jgi:hypothetical protein
MTIHHQDWHTFASILHAALSHLMYSAGMLDVTNACCLKHKDVIGSTCAPLSNMFGYFHAMRTCHAKLRYFEQLGWAGSLCEGQNKGQQGDPLEMPHHPPLTGTHACKVPAGPGDCIC